MKTKWKIVLVISLLLNLSIFYVGSKALEYRAHINEFLDKYTNVVKEFSQRAYYAPSNLRMQADSTVDNRVIFLGTQVTERWPIKELIPAYEAINRGIFGQRAAGLLLRFRPDVIDLGPEATVIEISSYNFRPELSVEEIEDYAASMAELAEYHNITPIMSTIIPPLEDSVIPGEYIIMDSLEVFNSWLEDYCRRKKFPLLNSNELLANEKGYLRVEYAAGGIDPNYEGYLILSSRLNEILAEILM